MTDLITNGGQAATMTSLELVDFINAHRKQQAEQVGQTFPSEDYPQLRHDHLMEKVPKVLGKDAPKFRDIYKDSMNRAQACYRFPKRESCLMAMSYSYDLQAAVFDHMTALEEKLTKPLTAAEQLLASVQLTVDLERRQRQTEHQVAALAETVGDMDRAHPLLDSIPNGMESITTIRQRIGKQYGLPPRVIDAVVREMPHSPRPFAMVRSKHEELNARPFAVWAKAEISRVFERFARGCTFVTPHRAIHPDFGAGIERFQMRGTPARRLVNDHPTEPRPDHHRPNGQPVIAGPWPSYRQFRDLPERERWVLYSHAKASRAALEDQVFVMAESYDDFVKRVTEELDV